MIGALIVQANDVSVSPRLRGTGSPAADPAEGVPEPDEPGAHDAGADAEDNVAETVVGAVDCHRDRACDAEHDAQQSDAPRHRAAGRPDAGDETGEDRGGTSGSLTTRP